MLGETADLPGEVIPGQIRLTVTDRKQALVENHKGIVSFENSEIILRGMRGRLILRGTGLYLAAMSEDWLLICGRIGVAEWE